MATVKPFLDTIDEVFADEPAESRARRRRDFARFDSLGLPSRRQEKWRFTNLRPLERQEFVPSGATPTIRPEAIAPYLLEGASHRIVLVNGRFDPALSQLEDLPKGVIFAPVSHLQTAREFFYRDVAFEIMQSAPNETDEPFATLNVAAAREGFVLGLPNGTVLDRPLEVVHVADATSPLAINTRSGILVADDARGALVETFIGQGQYWHNSVLRIRISDRSEFHHVVIQDQAREAIHTASSPEISVHKDSRYNGFNLTLGARLARQDVYLVLMEEGASCAFDGAYLLHGEQEATMASLIDHQAPGCKTREIFKGVVEDQAHGVFQGKIQVRPEAQQTDAHQLNKNLLLGERAIVDTKPELEILADDVKCSHGATVGDLDEAAMFYLRARGIPEREARRMLVEAFAADAIDLVEESRLQLHLRRHLERWLAARPH